MPQGSVLSPTLYNIYLADMEEPRHGDYIAYADDISQFVRYAGKSKEFLRRKTFKAITEINEFEKKWKINSNLNKFQIIQISKLNPLPITINGVYYPCTAGR